MDEALRRLGRDAAASRELHRRRSRTGELPEKNLDAASRLGLFDEDGRGLPPRLYLFAGGLNSAAERRLATDWAERLASSAQFDEDLARLSAAAASERFNLLEVMELATECERDVRETEAWLRGWLARELLDPRSEALADYWKLAQRVADSPEWRRLEEPGGLAKFNHVETALEFVLIPAGRAPGEDAFLLSATPALQAAWLGGRGSSAPGEGPTFPAHTISWHEAVAACSSVGLRLPSVSEWTRAARGPSFSAPYGFSRSSDRLGDHAWYRDNSRAWLHPPRLKLPNELGLFDLHGNVSEWCADRVDPPSVHSADRNNRAKLGGSTRHSAEECSIPDWPREGPHDYPTKKNPTIGFRPAASLPFQSGEPPWRRLWSRVVD